MAMKAKITIFILIFILLAGCMTYTQVWEKPGGNQQLFDLDSRECEYVANRVALQQSETGRKPDPAAFSRSYSECLEAKGWRKKTAADQTAQGNLPDTAQQLALALNANTVKGFGQTITVPDTFSLSTQQRLQSGPTILEQFSWKSSDRSFLTLIFQKNIATTFEQLPYPVSDPYLLYTSGIGEKAEEKLQWATFFGQTDSGWVMITGAYYYMSKKERIIIVITKHLASPAGPVAEKATLAKNQYLEIEEFSHAWQLWLNRQFTHGPGILTNFKKLFKFGL